MITGEKVEGDIVIVGGQIACFVLWRKESLCSGPGSEDACTPRDIIEERVWLGRRRHEAGQR